MSPSDPACASSPPASRDASVSGELDDTRATFVMDLVGRSVFGNATLGRFFGVTADETAGGSLRRFLASIHPDDVVRVVAAIEGLVDRAQRYRIIYRVRGLDHERTILACALLRRDELGAPIAVVGCARELGPETRTLVGHELDGAKEVATLAREMDEWLARRVRRPAEG